MTEKIQRRKFLKKAALVGGAGGVLYKEAEAHNPTLAGKKIARGHIRVGILGLGPYSKAADFVRVINEPSLPPRTSMRVEAIWGDNDYSRRFRGSSEFIKENLEKLSTLNDKHMLMDKYHIPRLADRPEDMLRHVDAVFITDPENSLALSRPFLERGMPVFIESPFAWTYREAAEIINIARRNSAPLVTGCAVPYNNSFQALASRVDPSRMQNYYIHGGSGGFISSITSLLETARLIGGTGIMKCYTHGLSWNENEDPVSIPPVMIHLEHYPASETARETGVGVVSTWRGRPHSDWVKVHLEREVLEQGILTETQSPESDERLYLPLIRMIDRVFQTGIQSESGDEILNKVRTVLMAHKSGIEEGRPVNPSEVEGHSLPRYITEIL